MINHGLLEYCIIPIVGGKKDQLSLRLQTKNYDGGVHYSEVTKGLKGAGLRPTKTEKVKKFHVMKFLLLIGFQL
jgi:hypothetical protein